MTGGDPIANIKLLEGPAKNLERFQAKWRPVRVKKTRQIKNLEPRFDSIETEKALASDAQEPCSIPKRQRWFETREGALLTMRVHTGNKPRIAGMLVPTPS
jgi:hypothetical protein